MSALLQELLTNNTKQMRIFLSQKFHPNPQLLRGNHSTAAFKKIIMKHRKVKNGQTYFKTVKNSKLTPESLKKERTICPICYLPSTLQRVFEKNMYQTWTIMSSASIKR